MCCFEDLGAEKWTLVDLEFVAIDGGEFESLGYSLPFRTNSYDIITDSKVSQQSAPFLA
jgi:hypothetical protein